MVPLPLLESTTTRHADTVTWLSRARTGTRSIGPTSTWFSPSMIFACREEEFTGSSGKLDCAMSIPPLYACLLAQGGIFRSKATRVAKLPKRKGKTRDGLQG